MPKYFFDLIGDESVLKDKTGMELPNDAAAYQEAQTRSANGKSFGPQGCAGYRSLIVRRALTGIVAAIPIPHKQN